MDRINGADTIDIGGGRRGFRDENLVAGAAGTEVTALWLNMIQEEILKVITEAGLVPTSGDWTQLWQALQSLGLAPDRSRRWLGVNSMTLSSAPGAPASGDAYLVPTGATGIWAGNVGKIALWSGTSWTYIVPTDGHGISLPDGRVFERVAGTYVEKLALDAQSGKWNFAVAGGTANALTATLNPAPQALSSGLKVVLSITATSTDVATLNLNGLGAKPILRPAGTPLLPGDLISGATPTLVYNGASWVLLSTPQNGKVGKAVLQTVGTGSFTVPDGVTRLKVRLWGAGGGGGGSRSAGSAGSAGASGGYCENEVSVTPGQVIAYTIGAGGAGGAQATPSNGFPGNSTSFGSYMSSTGGGGGGTGFDTVYSGAYALGGVPTGVALVIQGGLGGYGTSFSSSMGIGGVTQGDFGRPGGSLSSGVGAGGVFPGGGGGGGANGGNGGAGASGFIVVEW